jgi:hypothetical protein
MENSRFIQHVNFNYLSPFAQKNTAARQASACPTAVALHIYIHLFRNGTGAECKNEKRFKNSIHNLYSDYITNLEDICLNVISNILLFPSKASLKLRFQFP